MVYHRADNGLNPFIHGWNNKTIYLNIVSILLIIERLHALESLRRFHVYFTKWTIKERKYLLIRKTVVTLILILAMLIIYFRVNNLDDHNNKLNYIIWFEIICSPIELLYFVFFNPWIGNFSLFERDSKLIMLKSYVVEREVTPLPTD